MPKVIDVREKRREILAAAAATFARHGYNGTNLQRVAAAAGMGKSSIYHYFPTRDALFDALLRDLLQREEAAFDELAASPGPPGERLEALMDAILDLIGEWLKAGPLLVECLRDPRGRRAVQQALRRIRTALATLIKDGQRSGDFRGGNADALATVVVGCFDGVLLQGLLEPGLTRQAGIARELRKLIRAGLGKGEKQ